jgi:DNA-binding MarR family transcriptional regulator
MERDAALRLLDSCLFRIRRVQSSRRAARIQANVSGDWLSPTSLAIFAELEREAPIRMKALAERIQSDASRASREVHDLAQRGYVELVPDDTDGRVVLVQLTKLGARQWSAYHDEMRRILTASLVDWSDADLTRFATYFDRFLDTLGPAPGEDEPPSERPSARRKRTAR